ATDEWPALPRAPAIVNPIAISRATMGRGTGAALVAARAARNEKGGANVDRVRAALRGRAHAGQPSQAERHRGEEIDSRSPSDSTARIEATGCDYDRMRAERQASPRGPRTEHGEQRADGAERAAQESRGVGRHRSDAVHNPPAAGSEAVRWVLRL